MRTSGVEKLEDLGTLLAEAQLRGDAAMLSSLLLSDFKLVGPAGFVLDKGQWMDQFQSGRLKVVSLSWDEVEVREHDDVAVAIGRQRHQVTFQNQPSDGVFRVTLVAVRSGGSGWLLLGMHLSPIVQIPPPQ